MVRSVNGVANAIERVGISIIYKQGLEHSLSDEIYMEIITLV
jgi:hypothetical protein